VGLFLKNVARMDESVHRWAGGDHFKSNRVLILTNDEYASELNAELEKQQRYDYRGEILEPHQQLGDQYIATEADARKLSGKPGIISEQLDKAIKRSRDSARQIQEGRAESIVLAGEKAPLGHGEFFHQMVSSGLLLKLFKEKVRWISIRNIDNTAATFDWDWLVTLGVFLEEGLDFQAEVSPRIPNQKG